MRWYTRGVAIGAGYQVGLWKHKLYTTALGLYVASTIPYVFLGPWYALYVACGLGYLVSLVLRLLLFRAVR